MTGNEYKRLIGRYILKSYGDRGLQVFDEINLGTSIIGKQRRIDLFILQEITGEGLVLECKFQDSPGTVDEKIPYALDDLRALRMDGAMVYAGRGFSEGVLHLLQGSELAGYCLPTEELNPIPRRSGDPIDCGTWQLDHILAMRFRFWDLVLGERRRVTL